MALFELCLLYNYLICQALFKLAKIAMLCYDVRDVGNRHYSPRIYSRGRDAPLLSFEIETRHACGCSFAQQGFEIEHEKETTYKQE